jgi:PmbA protein
MINEILEIASKYVDSAEVYYLESKSTPVNFDVNKLKSIETKEVRGVCLRVIKDGKIGFSSTTDLDSGKFNQLVKNSVEIAEFGAEVGWNFPVHQIDSSRIMMKKTPDVEILVNTGKNIIKEVLEKEPETLNGVSLNYNSSREIILNSNGVSGHRERDAVSFHLVSQLIHGTDILYVYDGVTTNSPELNYLQVTEKVLDKIKHSKAIFQVNSKSMPVIFTPRGLDALLIPIEPALNGKSVLQGSSYFTNKMGKKVMDKRVTIYEDPSMGVYQLNFDDEGSPAAKKTFIENGILKTFYYDIHTAAEAKTQTTGNGFRNGLSSVSPGVSNLIFEKGELTFEEMVESVEEGIIVEQLLGAGQGNTLAGEFSLNISLGFIIEKGKIIGRIKDCMIAGNTFDALNDIRAIESETHWLSGGTKKLPSVMFNNMSVVGKK